MLNQLEKDQRKGPCRMPYACHTGGERCIGDDKGLATTTAAAHAPTVKRYRDDLLWWNIRTSLRSMW